MEEEEAQRYQSSGDALQACGRGDVCLKRSGALEASCTRSDVEKAEVRSAGDALQPLKN